MEGVEDILIWALGLTVAVPLIVVALSEGIERQRKRGSDYEPAFRALRNVFIPALLALILVSEVFGWSVSVADGEVLSDREQWQLSLRRVVETVFWFTFAYTILVFVGALTVRSRAKTADGEPTWEARLPAITRTVARVIAILLPFAMLASSVWNLDLTRFLTVLGVGSIAIGFALQSTFSSVISGILLALDRPFKEGDWIAVDGHTGQVIEINWRTTQIMVEGRDVVIIPNTTLLDSTLRNFTRIDVGYRDKIEFGFAYRNAPNLVRDVALRVARECPDVSDTPPAEVHMVEYGDSSVNYALHFHVARYGSPFAAARIREDLLTRLFYAAARHDLEIPFPIRTVRETHTGDMTDDERAEIGMRALKSSPATARAGDEVLRALAERAEVLDYGRGTPLSEIGEHEAGLSFIREGQVALRDAGGEEVLRLGPGQMMGVRQIVGRRANTLQAVAVSDVAVVRFPTDAVNDALYADAGLARSLHGYSDGLLATLDRKREDREREVREREDGKAAQG